VILFIACMIAVTVATAYWLVRRSSSDRVVLEVMPDRPCAFGCDMAWLAVRNADPEELIEQLGLFEPTLCNWDSGIGAVYDDRLSATHVFVSPPVKGWTFVVGVPLPLPMGPGFVDKSMPFLLELGRRFKEVQYFSTFPSIDLFAWARVKDKRLLRAFAVTDAGIVWNKGRASKEERGLGLKLFELRGVEGRQGDAGGEMILLPTEDHVLQLARSWSTDPTTLGPQSASPGLGWLTTAPAAWRSERIRNIA
jgi:hypothetical protein